MRVYSWVCLCQDPNEQGTNEWGLLTQTRSEYNPLQALSMTWAVYYTYHGNFHWNLFSIAFGLLWLCKVQHVLLNLKVTRKVILNLWCLWNLYFHRVCSCVIYMFFSLAYHFNVWLTIPDKNFTVDLLNSTSDEYWQTETEVMNKVRHHQLVFKIHLLRVSCRNKIFFFFFFFT